MTITVCLHYLELSIGPTRIGDTEGTKDGFDLSCGCRGTEGGFDLSCGCNGDGVCPAVESGMKPDNVDFAAASPDFLSFCVLKSTVILSSP